jgi:hypothetical protein
VEYSTRSAREAGNEYANFKKVTIKGGRWIAWSDDIDIDADSLYLKVTGKAPEELFPILQKDPAYA